MEIKRENTNDFPQEIQKVNNLILKAKKLATKIKEIPTDQKDEVNENQLRYKALLSFALAITTTYQQQYTSNDIEEWSNAHYALAQIYFAQRNIQEARNAINIAISTQEQQNSKNNYHRNRRIIDFNHLFFEIAFQQNDLKVAEKACQNILSLIEDGHKFDRAIAYRHLSKIYACEYITQGDKESRKNLTLYAKKALSTFTTHCNKGKLGHPQLATFVLNSYRCYTIAKIPKKIDGLRNTYLTLSKRFDHIDQTYKTQGAEALLQTNNKIPKEANNTEPKKRQYPEQATLTNSKKFKTSDGFISGGLTISVQNNHRSVTLKQPGNNFSVIEGEQGNRRTVRAQRTTTNHYRNY